MPSSRTSKAPKSRIDTDVKIGVDEPQIVAGMVFGTDFTSQELIMDYAYTIHNQDHINFIAEVREICFRSKLEYSPSELTAYLNTKKVQGE